MEESRPLGPCSSQSPFKRFIAKTTHSLRLLKTLVYEKLGPFVLLAEVTVVSTLGFTMIGIGEWMLAVAFWVFLGFLLIMRAFTSSNGLRKVVSVLGSVVLCIFLITVTKLRKPDAEPWSNIAKIFINKPSEPIFTSFTVNVSNMDERKAVKTFDGKPWDEKYYLDVRFPMQNSNAFPLYGLDMTLKAANDPPFRFYGHGQLSNLENLIVHEDLPQFPGARIVLRDNDGRSYNFPVPKTPLPSFSETILLPRMGSHEALELIFATTLTPVPKLRLHVNGTYTTVKNGSTAYYKIDKDLDVIQDSQSRDLR